MRKAAGISRKKCRFCTSAKIRK